eukprot:3594801-Prymnesium_polylepis.1
MDFTAASRASMSVLGPSSSASFSSPRLALDSAVALKQIKLSPLTSFGLPSPRRPPKPPPATGSITPRQPQEDVA